MFRLMPVHFACYAEGRFFVWLERGGDKIPTCKKIDAVAADLKGPRADIEAHHYVYLVKKS